MLFIAGCSKNIPPANNKVTYINVKDCGAIGNGINDDTPSFNLAMDKADSLHIPVFAPNGVYKVNLLISHDNLMIMGEQQPSEFLTEGTVFLGKINCHNKKNISIVNLGIDSRNQLGTDDAAALFSGDGADSLILNQNFQNISIIGDGYFSYKHGILCQTGSGIRIKHVTVSNFFHGIAIRASNVTIDSIYAISCGFTSIIVKSDFGLNCHTANVSINHVTITGDPNNAYNRGGAIIVQSYSQESLTNNINITNINSTNGGVACVAIDQQKGIVDNVSIANCNSDYMGDDISRACYDISGGSNITFTNCTTTNCRGYGYRSTANAANNIKIINCFESNSNAGSWTGTFTYLQLNGKVIIK